MIERRPLPDLSLTAHGLLVDEFARRERILAAQTVAALGYTEDDNWTVNFPRGEMFREIPDDSGVSRGSDGQPKKPRVLP
jgi:hypothetical protein